MLLEAVWGSDWEVWMQYSRDSVRSSGETIWDPIEVVYGSVDAV